MDADSVRPPVDLLVAVDGVQSLSDSTGRIELMFQSVVDSSPAAGGPVVRVPFAALAGPGGHEAAFHAAQLAALSRFDAVSAVGAGTAAESADEATNDVDEAVRVEHDLVEQIAALERVKARTEAAQITAIAELAGRPMFAGCAEHGFATPRMGCGGRRRWSRPSCGCLRRPRWPG